MYVANVYYNDTYGWEWKIAFFNHPEKDGKKSIIFIVNMDNSRIIVSDKSGITE